MHILGIATVRCGGDLPGQLTRTQQFPEADDYLPRVHTRIVFNEIGIPLIDYKHSFELCCTLLRVLRGKSQCFVLLPVPDSLRLCSASKGLDRSGNFAWRYK